VSDFDDAKVGDTFAGATMTGPDILVFLALYPIETVKELLDVHKPKYVVPYWWPDDPDRTLHAGKVTMAITPFDTSVGVMAIGKGIKMFDYINEVIDYFDLIVLTKDNLGENPEQTLYDLSAQGLLRYPVHFHIACGYMRPDWATFSYGEDFTSRRIERPDDD
jgi:hypothetical protein